MANYPFKITLDFCFIQEHWLFDDHLNDVREICSDFLSVGVSGMNSDTLRCGMVAVPFFTGSLCHPVSLFCNRILIVFVVLGCVIHLVSRTCLSVYTWLPIMILHVLMFI